jgi:hypothetical protein
VKVGSHTNLLLENYRILGQGATTDTGPWLLVLDSMAT